MLFLIVGLWMQELAVFALNIGFSVKFSPWDLVFSGPNFGI